MLLERDAYLDQLDALLESALAHDGRAAFISGEAGIGKTSLLGAFAERAGSRARILSAACEDLSAPEALSLLRDLSIVDQGVLQGAERGESRLALFNEVLDDLSGEPTVLLVEDIHWADDASLDFIRFVGRRLAGTPLLIAATSRNEESGARQRLHRAAADVPAAARTMIELPRLSSAAVGRMAAAQGLIGHAIHDATGGNPLFVSEMLSARGERPGLIDELVIARAANLSDKARQLLDHCCIFPRRTAYSQIAASGIEDSAIEECLAAGLLIPAEDGLSFRHELIRQAVEHVLPAFRKQRLHAEALARLETQGASAARLLHHALGARDAAKIAALAPVAAEQASALGSHRAAAQAWQSLLDLEGLEPSVESQARERHAFELHMFGGLKQAIEEQERALAIHAASKDTLRAGDCRRFLSRLHYLNGNRAMAEKEGHAAVETLEGQGESAELALAYANLAHLAMLEEDMAAAVRWSKLAEPMAEGLGRPDILATIFNNYGTAIQFEDADKAVDYVRRSIALGLETGSQEHVARAYTNLGWLSYQGLALEEADTVLLEGIAYCIDNDLGVWRDYMAGTRALVLMRQGRWDEAAAIAGEIVAREDNSLLMRNPAVRALAQIQVRRGEAEAQTLVSELRQHMEQGRELPRFAPYVQIVAELAWTAGSDPAPAVALVDEAVALLRPDHNPNMRGELAYWRRKLDTETDNAPDETRSPWSVLARGQSADAAARWEALGMPFERALALLEGSEDEAREGLDVLARLGATATEARARTELTQRGMRTGSRGPRASTRGNPFQLTRREIQVLAQLEKGLTNKQIGDLLFVSAKTVDHHVTSILDKLDARNRAEAGAIARREGLIPEPDAV